MNIHKQFSSAILSSISQQSTYTATRAAKRARHHERRFNRQRIYRLGRDIIGHICVFLCSDSTSDYINFLSLIGYGINENTAVHILNRDFVNHHNQQLYVRFQAIRVCKDTPTEAWLFALQRAQHIEMYSPMIRPFPRSMRPTNKVASLRIRTGFVYDLECLGPLHHLVHLDIKFGPGGQSAGCILEYISKLITRPLLSLVITICGEAEITASQLASWRDCNAINEDTVVDILGGRRASHILVAFAQTTRMCLSVSLFQRIEDMNVLTHLTWLGLNDYRTLGLRIDPSSLLPFKSLTLLGLFSYIAPGFEEQVTHQFRFHRPTTIVVSGYDRRLIEATIPFAKATFLPDSIAGWVVGPEPYYRLSKMYSGLHNVRITKRSNSLDHPFIWMCVRVSCDDVTNPVVVYDLDTEQGQFITVQ